MSDSPVLKMLTVCGARPNYVKVAPIIWALRAFNRKESGRIEHVLVHTGQHYDPQLSDVFFRELNIPSPDFSLGVGSGSHAFQTAEVMKRLEPILQDTRPDVVVVVGDVNSSMAASLTAAKLRIPVAHVEAGLRSFDRAMPEEINRIVTDVVSDYLFTTEASARENLIREGVDGEKIFFVGNVMIDSLDCSRELWLKSTARAAMGLADRPYGLVTLHRPSNVDNPEVLNPLLDALKEVARDIPLLFPVHPRTKARLSGMDHLVAVAADGAIGSRGLHVLDPLGYLDFMSLMAGARIVLTDSGGVQEETTALAVPCLTLRENTERPVTVTHGTNRIIGVAPDRVIAETRRVLSTRASDTPRPPLWDGRASERIIDILWRQVRQPLVAA